MGHKTTKSRYIRFIQCVLRKQQRELVTWLPETHAVLQKIVDLKMNGRWNTGWVIVELGVVNLDGSVMKGALDYRFHRRATDV